MARNCMLAGMWHSFLLDIGSNIALFLNLCIRETPKRVSLQTVKTMMKCSIMLHFIWVYTACKGKKDPQTIEYNIFGKL